MKKKLLLILAMLFTTWGTMAAYDIEVGGFYFDINGSEVTLTYESTSYNSYSGDVEIPVMVQHEGRIYPVTAIGEEAFKNCRNLTSVFIPPSIVSIGNHAFLWCSALTSIEIPNSVTSLGSHVFFGCEHLVSVTLPNTITKLDQQLFAYCKNLSSITIPNSVTRIGSNAFSSCTSLITIEIPESVTWIEGGAFLGCYGLTNIHIPKSVTSIGVSAFSQCKGLVSITVDPENPVFDSRNNCNAIISRSSNKLFNGCQNTVIPDGVESIREYAFSECSGLTTLDIPASMTEIGNSAFSQCYNLGKITTKAIVPPSALQGFSNFGSNSNYTYTNAVLFVPMASLEAYSADEEWGKFTHIVPFIGAGPGDIDGSGSIDVSDVTELIDLLLAGEGLPPYCDVDGNGEVDINDITLLIDMLLNQS